MKVGYFADGPWAHNAFLKLIEDKDLSIQFICVRYDSEDATLRDFAKTYSIPLLKNKNVNSKSFIELIKGYNCDLFISMSFNQIFKEEIINLTPYKIINCHAGKLPSYRGRNILNWALINDEKEFGITVHYVDLGIDTGNIIEQTCFPITDKDNYLTLLEKSYVECANLLYKAVCKIKKGQPHSMPQIETGLPNFYCGKRGPGDEIINWHQSSRELFNFIRAICSPGPKATTSLAGVQVKINSSRFISGLVTYKGHPGQILERTANGFLVKTLDSYLEIFDIEADCKIKIGDRLR